MAWFKNKAFVKQRKTGLQAIEKIKNIYFDVSPAAGKFFLKKLFRLHEITLLN